MLYDPPEGWMHGFPKEYRPLPGESVEETLIRDGYPKSLIEKGYAGHCRFIGTDEELAKLPTLQGT